jgi:hypothetical protein
VLEGAAQMLSRPPGGEQVSIRGRAAHSEGCRGLAPAGGEISRQPAKEPGEGRTGATRKLTEVAGEATYGGLWALGPAGSEGGPATEATGQRGTAKEIKRPGAEEARRGGGECGESMTAAAAAAAAAVVGADRQGQLECEVRGLGTRPLQSSSL